MKNIKFLLILCLINIIFFGCSQDNDTTIIFPTYPYNYWQPNMTNGNGQYAIGGYVAGVQSLTRAAVINTNDVIDNYSDFSLFAWTKDSIIMNNYNGVLNNQQGTWGYSEPKKFFDNNQPSYKFIGIIPKANYTLNNDATINVSLEDFVTEDAEVNAQKYNKEFITAKTSINKEDYANGATLAFEHQNSIVRIKFETDNTNNLEIIDFTPSIPGTPVEKITKITAIINKANILSNKNHYEAAKQLLIDADIEEVNNLVKLSEENGTPIDFGGQNWGTGWNSGVGSNSAKIVENKTSTDILSENYGINVYNSMLSSATGSLYPVYGINTGNLSILNGVNSRLLHVEFDDTNKEINIFGISNINSSDVTIHKETVNEGGITGKNGIVVLPATSANQTGKDAVISTFPETVTANVGMNGVTYTVNTTEDEIIFTKPGAVAYSVYSPTNWYTFPVTHGNDFGFTIKFSYTLNGVTRYDARVFVPAAKCNWQPGKWYDYVIKVNSTKHGKTDPEDADEDDPTIDEEFPIIVNSSVDQYTEGERYEFDL